MHSATCERSILIGPCRIVCKRIGGAPERYRTRTNELTSNSFAGIEFAARLSTNIESAFAASIRLSCIANNLIVIEEIVSFFIRHLNQSSYQRKVLQQRHSTDQNNLNLKFVVRKEPIQYNFRDYCYRNLKHVCTD